MSVEAFARALSVRVGNSTRKLVLMGFANHAHRDGRNTWCGVDTIAEYAECDERTAQRHIGKLLEDGFMREGDQDAPGEAARRGGRRTIVYDIAMTDAIQAAWRDAYDPAGGVRGNYAKAGSSGGRTAAERRRRGDKMTPQADPDPGSRPAMPPQVSRGDNLTPRQDEPDRGVTGVTPMGDTSDTHRGDIAVSPEPSLEPPGEPSFRAEPPTASRHGRGSAQAATAEKPQPAKTPRAYADKPAFDKAHALATWWYESFQKRGISIVGRPFEPLRRMLYETIRHGADPTLVRQALQTCGEVFPSQAKMQRELAALETGTAADSGRGRPAPANVWHDPEETPEESARRAELFEGVSVGGKAIRQ